MAYRKRSTGSRHRPIFLFSLDSFLSSVGFLPSILAADWTTAAGPKIIGSQETGDTCSGSAATGPKLPGEQRQQHRRRWRERNLRMRERSQGRRETASLAAYSENNHYTMAAAGHETGAGQLSFFIFLSPSVLLQQPPSSLSITFLSPSVPLPAPPTSLSYSFLSPSVPLPSVGPAGRSAGTTGSKAQNFSRYEVKKRISPRLTGKSEWGLKNEFQKV